MNTYIAIVLAVFAAITFGAFSIMAKKAMHLGSVLSVSLVSIVVGLPLMFVLSLFYSDWGKITWEAVVWFFLAGFLAPGLGRPLVYLAIKYVGVGRAMPLMTVTPFLSTVVAILWLRERPGLVIFGATALVVSGCFLIALKPESDKDWRRIYLLLPIAHSMVMAFATTTRRISLLVFPDIMIGITIASLASVPALFLFLPFLPPEERWRIEPGGHKMIVLTGLLNSFSFLIFFSAFQFGEVSIVVPIGYAAPLFALVFTQIWLQEEEILTWQKWVGAIFLFFGVVLIVTNAP